MIAAGREKKELVKRHFSDSVHRTTGKGDSERERSRVTPGCKPGDLNKRYHGWKKDDNF